MRSKLIAGMVLASLFCSNIAYAGDDAPVAEPKPQVHRVMSGNVVTDEGSSIALEPYTVCLNSAAKDAVYGTLLECANEIGVVTEKLNESNKKVAELESQVRLPPAVIVLIAVSSVALGALGGIGIYAAVKK